MKRRVLPTLLISVLSFMSLPASTAENSETDEMKKTGKNYVFGKIADMVSSVSNRVEFDNLKHLELSIIEEDWVIGGTATGVIGLLETADSAAFSQLSLSRVDKRTTGNVGFGYRSIPDNLNAIIGANVFFDEEFSSGHQRVGLGLEYLTTQGDIIFNHYNGISKEKKYKGVREKALDGNDLKISYRFDNTFQPELFFRGFEWKGENGYKVNGHEAGAVVSLNKNIVLRVSRKDDDKSKSAVKAMLTYTVNLGEADQAKPDRFTSQNPEKNTLRKRLFKPVQRENIIRKSQIKLGIVMSTY